MIVKGTLIGANCFPSKKGTDCFFGYLATNFNENEVNGLGYKVVQLAAFGSEAKTLYSKVASGKLTDGLVECAGLYNGGLFQTISIDKAGK